MSALCIGIDPAPTRGVVVYVADVGSKRKFHWVCSSALRQSSTDPEKLAQSIAKHLHAGNRVALGYESPLFVPCRDDHSVLGKARVGECNKATGNRAWSAQSGACSLATGLQSLAWVLRRLRELESEATATTSWSAFQNGAAGLFVWEAFVSGSEKAMPASHSDDARLAIRAFQHHVRARDMSSASRINEPQVFSLAGAAILFAGLSTDVRLLTVPCVVLRPIPNQPKAEA